MDASAICITLIITIFGIAYPILFQVVTRLDEKYSSTLIIDLFKAEIEWRLFSYSLWAALISILIWIFRLPTPSIPIKWLAFLIENSAIILLLITTILLTISFLFFVLKINVYYAPLKFIKYLIDQTKKDPQNLESSYFKAIGDLLHYSIKEQNEKICRTVSDSIYDVFQRYRDLNSLKPIEYPFSYYELVNKSTHELVTLDNKRLDFLIPRTVGGLWLLGERRDYQISDRTYRWLWSNLLLAVTYERDDMVLSFWEHTHQYSFMNLNPINPRYTGADRIIINQEEIDKRNTDRSKFIEFHYALGGLLLYRQRYNCIKRIFRYTTDIPPRYELLPTSMNEIFEAYFKFRDPYDNEFTWISSQFSFPELEGLEADGTIKHLICQYIALLFLRQYSIVPYLIIMKPLEPPTLPETQSAKKMWIDYLEYFQRLVENLHNSENIKSETGLEFLTDQWCRDNQKPTPLELMSDIKTRVSQAFEVSQVTQEISEIKRGQFQTTSASILTSTFHKYDVINNPKIFESDYNNWYISGDRAIVDKSAFAEDQESHNVNFDSYLAETISNKFSRGISDTFYFSRSNSYLVKPENLFHAIDRLKITGDNFIIVSFGINIVYYKDYFNIAELSENKYKNIEIIKYDFYNHQVVGESVFILRKEDFPHLEYMVTDSAQIEKYSLVSIDENFKIYSSVIPLNKNDSLRAELTKNKSDDELKKSVLICISFKTEIRWRKNIKNIMIRTSSPFKEKGLPNELKDIKEF